MNMIKRALITNPSKDDGQFGVSQSEYLGKTGNAQDVFPYGMHAVPPEGTLTLLMNVNGQEENGAQIPMSDQLRTKNKKPGEVEFGNMVVGSIMIFKENGDWNVTIKGDVNLNVDGDVNITAGGDVNVTASSATVTASTIDLDGNCSLGSGGPAISRVGDTVIGLGPSFPVIGSISTGSGNHTAS